MRIIACLILGLSAGACTSALSQETVPPERITVNVRQVPLRAALKQMLAGTSARFEVDAKVPDVPITLNIRDIGVEALMRIMVRAARTAKGADDLCVTHTEGIYRLRLDPKQRALEKAEERAAAANQDPPLLLDAAFQDPRLERKITQTFKKQTLGEVAKALFSGTGCRYSFSGKSNEIVISMDYRDVQAQAALRLAVAAAAKIRPGIVLRRDGNVYVIGPATGARPDQP